MAEEKRQQIKGKKLEIKRHDKKLDGHEVTFESIKLREAVDIVEILHEDDQER